MEDFCVIERIKTLCNEKKWSFYHLAKESDIPHSSLNSMLKHNHIPTIANLKKICDALQITLFQFFDDELFGSKNIEYNELWKALTVQDQEKALIYMYGLLHKIPPEDDLKDDI